MSLLQAAFEQIEERCPFLKSAWTRSKQNTRLFNHTNETYGGASRVNSNWILLSYQWLHADAELSLAHELLHVAGHRHLREGTDSESWDNFVELERQCSGGRSALESTTS